MLNVANFVLHFVLYGNVFPRCQENALVHLSVFSEENVHWNDAAEVEDVDAVFDSHLYTDCNKQHVATHSKTYARFFKLGVTSESRLNPGLRKNCFSNLKPQGKLGVNSRLGK